MASTRPRPRAVPWLAGLSTALGGFTAGIGGNLVAADFLYRGFAVLSAATAILATAAWLRGFKPDFALVVWVVRGFLLIAVAAVVAATMVGTTASGVAVLVAALAILGATLVRSDPADRLALLCGVALIAMGVGMFADAASAPRVTANGRLVMVVMGVMLTLFGVAAMGLGRSFVGFVKFTLGLLLDEQVPMFLFAAAGVVAGVLSVTRGSTVAAVVAFLFAAGVIGVTVGHRRQVALVGGGAVVVGTAGAIAAVASVVAGEALIGAAMAGVGAAAVVTGVTYLSRRGVFTRLRSWLDAAKR